MKDTTCLVDMYLNSGHDKGRVKPILYVSVWSTRAAISRTVWLWITCDKVL